ncbi:MAG: phenylalanine--tRNA ligase subunit beta [Candidatus Omnitrophota bacterium]|jgi:phenylalanyl-tRNA synthetase beta chain
MKVTYNWLKDFVEIKIPAKELADKLTMAGLEVTHLETRDGDFVFELEITSNRPDLLSVIGIAREVAAITGKKLKPPQIKGSRPLKQTPGQLTIKIENKDDCPLYTAKIIKGVEVGSSPEWLKRRLELVGLRSINNIVDITNYVLMTTGQPLHAFDLNRIKDGAIFVRRAKGSEKIVLIDGEKYNLTKDMLIIADKGKPIAIAGIMGGGESEVNQSTCDILLEAAVFDPVTTRRASRALGLSSESSYRFERGIDSQSVEAASMLAVNFILKLAGGKLTFSKATSRPKTKKKTISLKHNEVSRILGRDYSAREIKQTLTSLCFLMGKHSRQDYKVSVPSFRIDVSQPVDLVEEIARISGYEKIPSRLPRIIPQDARIYSEWIKTRQIKNILISQGINEVVTYSLLGKRNINEFGYPDIELMTVANPLSSEQEVLRPSIIPGLITCVGYNLNQKQRDVRIFEIGNIFRNNQETPFLGVAYCGREPEKTLRLLRGLLEMLCYRSGISKYEFGFLAYPCFSKDISLSLVVNKKSCASLGMVKPAILEKLDIKDYIFAAEIDLELFFAEIEKSQKRYTPIPLYPEAARDISIVLKQNIPVGDVIKRIKLNQIRNLVEFNLKDEYSGKQIPPGHKGLTLSCIYRASDHTLTAQEVDISQQRILDILRTEFSAQQR